ncbi:zinc finger containing protein [Stemphylium lycopersici]|uniref:Zinc finger containing protein n=1 Tax=Stemphylium lycopersici TaxID=183478 RepID=A0A364MXM0_STELY|nr:ccch finger dna binding protein [Stemphylium lycopersici]RAR06602.1 zinc finger containing protein [Stemphylium lycopersici]RAR11283.1 zinc finger containing protein [Stemphylium lycopersici]
MPPKGKGEQPKVKKVAVDKTFGMKNKKGGAAQKQIAQLKATQASGGTPDEKRKAAEKAQREKDKAAAEAARKETAELFKPVQVQKVPFGTDPKTVLCQFFKKGNCDKGKKCKFSHDLAIERKTEKRSLYTDNRDQEKEEEEERRKKDNMDEWDEDKLRQVVLSKHGNPKTTTDKVCKYFIQAIEDQKYGWFWTCPNGGDKCFYKHSLPPGFVIKTKEQRAAEKALMANSPLNTLTLEDFLESERHKLTGNLTPVTPETFAKWKKERVDKKQAEEEAKKLKDATGRAMFEKGDWARESDGESSDDDDDDDEWNLETMRKETEAARARKEEERMAAALEKMAVS